MAAFYESLYAWTHTLILNDALLSFCVQDSIYSTECLSQFVFQWRYQILFNLARLSYTSGT